MFNNDLLWGGIEITTLGDKIGEKKENKKGINVEIEILKVGGAPKPCTH